LVRVVVGTGSEEEKRERHLGQYAPSTSDVQNVHTLQHAAGGGLERRRSRAGPFVIVALALELLHLEHLFADEAHPVRVHLVQECELATFVPPERRKPREVGDLSIVDGRKWWRGRRRRPWRIVCCCRMMVVVEVAWRWRGVAAIGRECADAEG
jgi:hypothetical protein